MTPRNAVAAALTFASVAVLGSQVLSYGLVYPAGAAHTKSPIALAVLGGALLAGGCTIASFRALRRAQGDAERFTALLGLVLSSFFLFVVVVGFGIPSLFLSPKD